MGYVSFRDGTGYLKEVFQKSSNLLLSENKGRLVNFFYLLFGKWPVWQVTVNNGVHDHKMMVNVDHFASKSTNHNS